MFWQDRSFIALDIETTGLDPSTSEIIEIGAALFTSGEQTETFSVVIKPLQQVPNFIKQLTGITDAELAKGLSATKALNQLLAFVGREESVPLVCHNSSFDVGFIQHHLALLKLPYLSNNIIDTLPLSKIYLPFIANHKLGTVANGLKVVTPSLQIEQESTSKNIDNPHRALFDAATAGNVLIKLTEIITTYIPYNLNSFIRNIAGYSSLSDYMAEYLGQLIVYQGETVLSSAPLKIQDSPLAESLGFNKSHNTLSTLTEDDSDLLFKVDEDPDGDRKAENDETQILDDQTSLINSSFDPDGYINSHFTGYKYRDGQVEMAHAVRKALFEGEHLLVEAGTGIGKTFAYLVAALEFTFRNQKKVYISTNTKNLQEQIFFKDLPVLKECIPLPFKAIILKGRDNYLCLRKWDEIFRTYKKMLSEWETSALLELIVWQYYTNTGDISENSSFLKESDNTGKGRYATLWKKLSTDRFFCSGKYCSHFLNCYYQKIRQKAELSNLIIINHHLLFADLSSNRFENEDNHIIIDEAHNLPELACQFLGISLAYYDFNSFFSHLFIVKKDLQSGLLVSLKADIQKSIVDKNKQLVLLSEIESIITAIQDERIHFDSFFQLIGQMVDGDDNYGKMRIKERQHQDLIQPFEEMIAICIGFQKKLFDLSQALLQINKDQIADYDNHQDKLSGAIETVREIIEALKILKEPDWNNFVFWISSFKTNDITYPNGIVNYSPLDVSELLQAVLYRQIKSLVFTSATLSLRNSFKFFNSRMGIPLIEETNVEELIVPSPFDFDSQTKVLVPKYLPLHTDKYFQPQSIDLLKGVLASAGVGTMVLFTSYRDLNIVYDELNQYLYEKNITLLAQGKGMSRTALLSEFKQNGKAVLLGTSSFWEGVDVPGDSLSLLILYKLPFQVPSEPIIEAYYDKLRKENKDPFMHATLPNAMLKFRQGFGRLIRNHTDKGIVLILDSRVVNKKYGIYFREILPTIIRDVGSPLEVEDIIANWFRKK